MATNKDKYLIVEDPDEPDFSNDQINAILSIESWWSSKDKQVYELSGIAGSGKSTLVRYIIDRLGINLKKVLFCAFSGKAVSELQKRKLRAQTIHSAFYEFVEDFKKDSNGNIIRDSNGYPMKVPRFVKKKYLDRPYVLIVVDEAGMVGERLGKDILSFDIPVICVGDKNQLQPVMDKPFFMYNPDYHLSEPHRQNADSPILWLARRVLRGENLPTGMYDNCSVFRSHDLSKNLIKRSNIILTGKNETKNYFNDMIRREFKGIQKLAVPHRNERVICKTNNWNMILDDGICLVNGTTGIVQDYRADTYNGISFEMDIRPDYGNGMFKRVLTDYVSMFNIDLDEKDDEFKAKYNFKKKFLNKVEFGYSVTVHSSQGGQWDNVLFICENTFDRDFAMKRSFRYTAITRAKEEIHIVLPDY